MPRLLVAALAGLVVLVSGCATMRTDAAKASASPPSPDVVRTDLHIHVSMDRAARPIFKGHSGEEWIAGDTNAVLVNQVDANLLQQSGVRLVFGAVWPPYRMRPGRDAREEALEQLHRLKDFASTTSGFAIAKDAEQARSLLAHGYVTVIPSVEGGEGLTSPDDVDLYFASGARVITLAHFVSNAAVGAAGKQLARAVGMKADELNDEGLSPLGREVVKRMIALGMVIDLAHASDRTMREVLDITEPLGVPVLVSHTGTRSFVNTERNVSDELAQRIVKSGGIIGVTIYKGIVSPVPQDAYIPGHVAGTCDDSIAQWKHFAALVGAENVTLGSDFNGMAARDAAGGSCPTGLRHVGDLGEFYAALEKNGVPPAAIDGAGERLLQLMTKVEEKAAPDQRARAMKLRVPRAPLLASPL